GFTRNVSQVGYLQVDPAWPHQPGDSGPDLTGHLRDRDPPPAAHGDQHVVGGYPHPGYLASGQVGHHAAPGARGKVVDGRAAADRRGHGVQVDAVDDRLGLLGHDTREGESSWSSVPGIQRSSTLMFTSTTSSPVIRSTACLTLRWMLRPRSAMLTPYSTTMSRSIAAWVSPTSTPTPWATLGPLLPGIRSRTAPYARVVETPMACTPLISRQAIPAIFCTTLCATLILPSSVDRRSAVPGLSSLVRAAGLAVGAVLLVCVIRMHSFCRSVEGRSVEGRSVGGPSVGGPSVGGPSVEDRSVEAALC